MSIEVGDNRFVILFNLSLFFEIFLESIPQIIIVNMNQHWNTSKSEDGNGDILYWFTVISAVLVILNHSWNLIAPMCRFHSFNEGLQYQSFKLSNIGAITGFAGITSQTGSAVVQLT